MGFVEVMKDRGLLAQVTHEDELIKHLAEKPRTAYAGFDPTADSLHIGHLIPVLALRRWQKEGHRVIALVGGGTGLVGDPTGKTEMRQMTTADVIDQRNENFKNQLSRFIDFSDESKGIIVNNADWLRSLEYLPFLREIGSHFNVNRMLSAECFKQRMETGLSFLEFNYMILQSYDFYHLFKNFDCTVQMGGDDQWSNMLGGMDLVRKKAGGQAYCLTVPLLANSQGKKMGKTESGAVWIDAHKTSPYDLFQYFRNVEDDMVKVCLMYFSDLPADEVKRLSALEGQKINEAKVTLAYEATKLIHNEEEAIKAKEMASKLFSSKPSGSDAPEITISGGDVTEEMGLIDFLMLTKIFPSKGELRRLIQQGGITIEGEKMTDPKALVSKPLFTTEKGALLKKGKKSYYTIKIV